MKHKWINIPFVTTDCQTKLKRVKSNYMMACFKYKHRQVANCKHKESGTIIFISDKVDFKTVLWKIAKDVL
jgi:hypothetical protein